MDAVGGHQRQTNTATAPIDTLVLCLSLTSVIASFVLLSFETVKTKQVLLPLWTFLQCIISIRLALWEPATTALDKSVPLYLEACVTYVLFLAVLAVSLQ